MNGEDSNELESILDLWCATKPFIGSNSFFDIQGAEFDQRSKCHWFRHSNLVEYFVPFVSSISGIHYLQKEMNGTVDSING
jgi:hypothetical protein